MPPSAVCRPLARRRPARLAVRERHHRARRDGHDAAARQGRVWHLVRRDDGPVRERHGRARRRRHHRPALEARAGRHLVRVATVPSWSVTFWPGAAGIVPPPASFCPSGTLSAFAVPSASVTLPPGAMGMTPPSASAAPRRHLRRRHAAAVGELHHRAGRRGHDAAARRARRRAAPRPRRRPSRRRA